MHIAVLAGRHDILELLLEKGAYPDQDCNAAFKTTRDGVAEITLGGTPLHLAIFLDRQSCVNVLLRKKASIHLKWTEEVPRGCVDGMTALAAACKYGSLPIVQLIMMEGYQQDIDVQDPLGNTPLVYSFTQRNWDCFGWLVSMGADINAKMFGQDPLLVYACHSHQFQEAYQLIDLGADINVKKMCSHFGPLHLICERPWSGASGYSTEQDSAVWAAGVSLMDKLLENGANINARGTWCYSRNDDLGATPLGLAATANNILATRYLLSKGADLHGLQRRSGASVLMLACMNPYRLPNADMVKTLVDTGADVSHYSCNYGTALEKVCLRAKTSPDKLQVIKILLAHGASALVTERLSSPLTAALRVADAAACDLLLRSCSSSLKEVDIRAMFRALLRSPNADCLALLLNADQNSLIINDNSSVYRLLRALSNITKRKSFYRPGGADHSPELALHILNRGARCDYTDDQGDTALTLALKQKCSSELLRKLLELGADANQGPRRERSPLSIAVSLTAAEGQWECVKLLLDAGAKGIHKRFPGAGDSIFVHAIANTYGAPKIFDLLLEHEPLLEHPEAPLWNMIATAIRYGRYDVFQTIIQSHIGAEGWIVDYTDQFLLFMLDAFHEGPVDIVPTVERMDDWYSCLDYLLSLGADLNAEGTTLRGWQILFKALQTTLGHSDRPMCRPYYLRNLGLAICLRQKIHIPNDVSLHQVEAPNITFNHIPLCFHHPPSTTMLQFGERCWNEERRTQKFNTLVPACGC